MRGGTSKKRQSRHLHKIPTWSNKVSPWTLQTALVHVQEDIMKGIGGGGKTTSWATRVKKLAAPGHFGNKYNLQYVWGNHSNEPSAYYIYISLQLCSIHFRIFNGVHSQPTRVCPADHSIASLRHPTDLFFCLCIPQKTCMKHTAPRFYTAINRTREHARYPAETIVYSGSTKITECCGDLGQ
jgi:hypothetical protein